MGRCGRRVGVLRFFLFGRCLPTKTSQPNFLPLLLPLAPSPKQALKSTDLFRSNRAPAETFCVYHLVPILFFSKSIARTLSSKYHPNQFITLVSTPNRGVVPTWEDLVDSESTGPEADQHWDKGPAQPPWHRNGRGTAASLLQSLQRRRRIAKRLLLLLSPPLLLETLR